MLNIGGRCNDDGKQKSRSTSFSREDFLRFERVNREILDDEMEELLRNNPTDVVYKTFAQAFFQGMVKLFQHDNEMRNIVMTDSDAREQAMKHIFSGGPSGRQQKTEPPNSEARFAPGNRLLSPVFGHLGLW